ncbi:MAG: patatin-like phospholipase family protein [Gemmatimonadetes bacterium]|nr:patatin-like phospholipase family protein [Gemmatimonadota bacterium]
MSAQPPERGALAKLRRFAGAAGRVLRLPGREREPWEERERIVLVLSGGGLRGLAHVGAWRALLELGIRPDAIVGTSIGGLVAAAAAAGADWDVVERAGRSGVRKEIAALDRRVLLLNGVHRPALFRGEVLRRYVEQLLPARTFEELAIPFQVNAVNFGTGEMRWFGIRLEEEEVDSTVGLVDAVTASCSVPTFYPPVKIGDAYYVDGGVLDTFALRRAAELGATRIIAIDATRDGTGEDPEGTIKEGMLAINERVFGIVAGARRRSLLEEWSDPPLTLIRPAASAIPAFDFGFNDYLVDEGYRATHEALAGAAAAKLAGAAAESTAAAAEPASAAESGALQAS